MSDKPSYLGLLNAVSLAESNAYCYLSEWAAVTKDPDVRRVLLTVAAREGEHGMTFAKRINELGYELFQRPDENLEKNLEIVRSDCSDLEKMEALGFGSGADAEDKPDFFDDFFKDHSIDIQTGEMLGRYIAEERDSGRLLRGLLPVSARRRGRRGGSKWGQQAGLQGGQGYGQTSDGHRGQGGSTVRRRRRPRQDRSLRDGR